MKIYKPKTIMEAINHLQTFLEVDLYTRFHPRVKMKGEYWTRDKKDVFKNEKEFLEYLNDHFNILRKQIKQMGGSK